MSILSLTSAAALLIGAGSWGGGEARFIETKLSGYGDWNSGSRETLVRDPMHFYGRQARKDDPLRFVMKELKRDFCSPESQLEFACIFGGGIDGEAKGSVSEDGDRATEITNSDKPTTAIVPVPGAAPILLSALTGFAFASRGRRNSGRPI